MKVAARMEVIQQRSESDIRRRESHDADRDYRLIIIEIGEDTSDRAGSRGG